MLVNLQNASEKNILEQMFVSQNHPRRPNKGLEFANGLTSLLVEKILTGKTLQVH